MRFELIDAVLEQEDDRIVAVKSVSSAEEYLGDHFPGFPVLPGVMMLEAMVQSARKLLNDRASARPWVLAEVRNVRYGNMVKADSFFGSQLEVNPKRPRAGGV